MIARSCCSAVISVGGESIYGESTALHEAVWMMNVSDCARLINEGADVNARCEHVYWPAAFENT